MGKLVVQTGQWSEYLWIPSVLQFEYFRPDILDQMMNLCKVDGMWKVRSKNSYLCSIFGQSCKLSSQPKLHGENTKITFCPALKVHSFWHGFIVQFSNKIGRMKGSKNWMEGGWVCKKMVKDIFASSALQVCSVQLPNSFDTFGRMCVCVSWRVRPSVRESGI